MKDNHVSVIWTQAHRLMLILDWSMFIVSILMAVILAQGSQRQRVNLDISLQEITGNQTILGPLMVMFVLIALGYLFFVFKIHAISYSVRVRMAKVGEHAIMAPLLYIVLFFFMDDLVKSCSAEIIVTSLFLIIIVNGLFTLLCVDYALTHRLADD